MSYYLICFKLFRSNIYFAGIVGHWFLYLCDNLDLSFIIFTLSQYVQPTLNGLTSVLYLCLEKRVSVGWQHLS